LVSVLMIPSVFTHVAGYARPSAGSVSRITKP
jgi:hypothetical protein